MEKQELIDAAPMPVGSITMQPDCISCNAVPRLVAAALEACGITNIDGVNQRVSKIVIDATCATESLLYTGVCGGNADLALYEDDKKAPIVTIKMVQGIVGLVTELAPVDHEDEELTQNVAFWLRGVIFFSDGCDGCVFAKNVKSLKRELPLEQLAAVSDTQDADSERVVIIIGAGCFGQGHKNGGYYCRASGKMVIKNLTTGEMVDEVDYNNDTGTKPVEVENLPEMVSQILASKESK